MSATALYAMFVVGGVQAPAEPPVKFNLVRITKDGMMEGNIIFLPKKGESLTICSQWQEHIYLGLISKRAEPENDKDIMDMIVAPTLSAPPIEIKKKTEFKWRQSIAKLGHHWVSGTYVLQIAFSHLDCKAHVTDNRPVTKLEQVLGARVYVEVNRTVQPVFTINRLDQPDAVVKRPPFDPERYKPNRKGDE